MPVESMPDPNPEFEMNDKARSGFETNIFGSKTLKQVVPKDLVRRSLSD
jgi:hypothetical protein